MIWAVSKAKYRLKPIGPFHLDVLPASITTRTKRQFRGAKALFNSIERWSESLRDCKPKRGYRQTFAMPRQSTAVLSNLRAPRLPLFPWSPVLLTLVPHDPRSPNGTSLPFNQDDVDDGLAQLTLGGEKEKIEYLLFERWYEEHFSKIDAELEDGVASVQAGAK